MRSRLLTLLVLGFSAYHAAAVPVATIVPTGTAHEGEAASFKITLSEPAAAGGAQVQVSAQSATAVEGQDFAAFSATVSIPDGASESAAQALTIVADTTLEVNESFILASGASSGCVVGKTAVPVVIAANGFNVRVHRKVADEGKLSLWNVWGYDGTHLVATGTYPNSGGILRTMVVDAETGAIAGELANAGLSNASATYVQDGIFFANVLDMAYAWQLPGGQVIGTAVEVGGRLIGPLDAQHMLVRKAEPDRLVVANISDAAVTQTHPIANREVQAVIAPTMEGLPGRAVVVLDQGVALGGESVWLLKILNPATLEVERSFSWPALHPQLGVIPRLAMASGRHAVFTSEAGLSAVDTVTGEWRWTLPFGFQGFQGFLGSIHGDLLLANGLQLTQATDEFQRFRSIDLKSGAVLETWNFEELSGEPFFTLIKTQVQTANYGFTVLHGGQAVSLTANPFRPNARLVTEPFADNRSGELKLEARENFTGSVPLVIDEYATVLADRPAAERQFTALPLQVNFTSAGNIITLEPRRPASGAEPVKLRAMAVNHPAGAAAGFTKTTVSSHVGAAPEQAFFTGGPLRNTEAVAVVKGSNVVALGYPLEPEPFTNPTGVVDLYDATTGAFLRSIAAPAGVTGKRFGATLAISGSRIVAGAPGNNGYPSLPGQVFVFEASSGALVKELKLKKTQAFGSALAANDKWIAVGAPGTYRVLPPTGQNDRRKLVPGTVAVFDATTFKLRFKAATKGEMLGWSLALDGDTLFAGAPLASIKKPVQAIFAGVVRPYTLPQGKKKGKALPLIASLGPISGGHFGEQVAANSSILAVYSTYRDDDKREVQVHLRNNLGTAALFGVPGGDVHEGVLQVSGERILAGGLGGPLRIFDMDDQRPEASYSLNSVQGLAVDETYFYWADKFPHRALLPAAATARSMASVLPVDGADLNHDGRTDAIDLLLQQRGGKGMPITIDSRSTGSFRLALDADIPAGMEVSLEYSVDLANWLPLVTWPANGGRWLDGTAKAVGGADGPWLYDWKAPVENVFFRTQVQGPE